MAVTKISPCKEWRMETKLSMHLCSVNLFAIVILASLPYISTLSLPTGDPAPGRSPGPPETEPYPEIDTDANLKSDVVTSGVDYEETTTNGDVTTVSNVGESETVNDACAFARIPSESDEVVALSDDDSDVNLTVSHSVFETDQLVRGVVYDVHLQFGIALRDYVLYSIVGNFIRGNFTPTSFAERPCRDEPVPYFIPKHRPERSKHNKRRWNSKFERTFEESEVDFRTAKRSEFDDYYFRPRFGRAVQFRVAKSVRYRRRFLPARIVSGPLGERDGVLLQWSIGEGAHLENEDASVVFRLRYRKITSATIYQVFFTKYLRLDCALLLRAPRGRVHSGQLPRTHGCRLLVPPPPPHRALLLDLYKLNVPCAGGFIRFAPNTPPLCGKLEQIAPQNRKFIYFSTSKNPAVELHGRPTFAVAYRLVDHCHDVLLTVRNGSFEVGPTTKLFCSYKIHLPYGNKVALRLQMGTGTIATKHEISNIIQEDYQPFCKGMELTLEDGDSRWKHCSQPGDPLRSVQIISEKNSVRLNISILAKRNSSAMWLKVWWMDKAVEEVTGHCDYGWVVSDDFCVTAVREGKRAWRQAEAECVRLGGHLASVLNERQQRVMDQLLIHAPGAGVDDVYWIGATDAVLEGEFRWSDGLPFSYAHWFPGWRKHSSQPNDDGTSGQDCVEVRRELPPRPPPAAASFMWNDRGCREHNYFVCERPAVDDPYVSSSIQCNETIVLSHLRPHAIVSSPGFPRAYPDDVECTSELRAPPAHTLLVHFEELLTEHEPHCSYDFLEIIEIGVENATDVPEELLQEYHAFVPDNEVWEDTETLLPESDAISAGWVREGVLPTRRLCGDWGSKLKLLRYRSRGNALRLRFRADHSRHYAGFKAKVTVADSQTCTDVKQVLFNGYCYIFSGYPRVAWATAKQVCEGLSMRLSSVHSADEERFIVSGIRQSSDYSAGTVYWLGARGTGDNFSWSDGSAVSYRGWQTNETLVEDACLGVQWKSSPVPSQPSGLYWTLHKCSVTGGYVCKRRLSSEVIVRNSTVEGSSGSLSSPEYPNMYDNDLDYWVHVVGPPDTRLVFVFQRIELEFQKDCLYDYVELRDALSLRSSRYCGTVGETRWVASSNRAVLHFHSDYNTQAAGFSVTWQAVELEGCPSQTFTSKEGVLRSPNYPHFLLPDLDCTIDILAPAGKRVFLNISYFDFGFGSFEKGIPSNLTEIFPEDSFLEVQVDLQDEPIRPFLNPDVLTNGLFISTAEILRLKFKTGANVTGKGFLAHFKTVHSVNATHTVDLTHVRAGRLAAPNWPRAPPPRVTLRARLLAPHEHTLSVAFAGAALAAADGPWPCGEGKGWIEVVDSYSDSNGTAWTLCEAPRARRAAAPLVVHSHLHALSVALCAARRAARVDVTLLVVRDPDYHSKVLLLPDETNIESCYPEPCLHGGRCTSDDTKNFCQCSGYYTGIFCVLTACERSPCAFGNCSLAAGSFACACARGWRGRRCAERVRACAARPCNSRGACTERDGGFLCQCNPSWKGKRCEIPNPTPKIVSLGTRMIQEPFWLGLIAVFVVLGVIGLVWCAKRHFPEKIEKLLAEEADRCARPVAPEAWVAGVARPRAAVTSPRLLQRRARSRRRRRARC